MHCASHSHVFCSESLCRNYYTEIMFSNVPILPYVLLLCIIYKYQPLLAYCSVSHIIMLFNNHSSV